MELAEEKRGMSWSLPKKREGIFVPIIFSEGNFFNICVLPQCIVFNWIHFQNVHTFTYQKAFFSYTFLLVFEVVESLQCILKDAVRESTSLNKTEALMNMHIWVIGTVNQVFIRSSYTRNKFSKKWSGHWQKSTLCDWPL